MLIEIDIRTLKKSKLTPNQFIILYLIYKKAIDQLKDLRSIKEDLFIADILYLIDIKMLGNTKDTINVLEKLYVTVEFLDIVHVKDPFEELHSKYPKVVIRPDGKKDYLRTDLTRCRTLYKRAIGKNKTKHEYILKCLDYELAIREKEDSMKWMTRLSKWISSEGWNVYAERMDDEANSDVSNANKKRGLGYGNDLL